MSETHIDIGYSLWLSKYAKENDGAYPPSYLKAKAAREAKPWPPPKLKTDLSAWLPQIEGVEASTCTDGFENQYPVYTMAKSILQMIKWGEVSARASAIRDNQAQFDAAERMTNDRLIKRQYSSRDVWWYAFDVPRIIAWAVHVISNYENNNPKEYQ